jgi:uncharacterized protein YndB with AHSA1/START domain
MLGSNTKCDGSADVEGSRRTTVVTGVYKKVEPHSLLVFIWKGDWDLRERRWLRSRFVMSKGGRGEADA